jgi:hypothetical protein
VSHMSLHLQERRAWLSPQSWSALFFSLAAMVAIISWLILLLTAQPKSQSTLEAAINQLRFVFSTESPALWWFVGWAALPVVFVALAIYSMSSASRRKWHALAIFIASLALLAVSLAFFAVEVATLSAGASINAFRIYRSAT